MFGLVLVLVGRAEVRREREVVVRMRVDTFMMN